MVWLADGEKQLKIRLLYLTEFTNVTDGQTDRRTDGRTDTAWQQKPIGPIDLLLIFSW